MRMSYGLGQQVQHCLINMYEPEVVCSMARAVLELYFSPVVSDHGSDSLPVTCPGVILKDRGDVFLRVVVLGFQKNSLCLPPVFPLLYHQTFTFERAFPGCSRLIDLEHLLEEEPVLVELIQLDEVNLSEGAKVIAFYHSSVKEFLFPEDSLIPSYADSEQEVLMQRSIWFSGISPKLEFSSKTTVRDTSTPFLDSYYENGSENTTNSKSVSFVRGKTKKSRRRTHSYGTPTTSSILKSPRSTKVPLVKSSKMEERAPFIVKRKDSFNRAVSPSRARSPSPRRPASAPPKTNHSFKRKSYLPRKDKAISSYISEEDCRICQVYQRYLGRRYWGHKKYYHPSRDTSLNRSNLVKVGEDEYRDFPHQDSSMYVDEETDDIINGMNGLQFSEPPTPGPDVEYGRLPYSPRVSRRRSRSPARLRARSASPRGRLGSPDISGQIRRRVQRALENEYVSDESEISSVTSEEALESLRETLLQSPRRRRVSVHIDEGHYWSNRRGIGRDLDTTPRERFNDTLSRIYKRLHRTSLDSLPFRSAST